MRGCNPVMTEWTVHILCRDIATFNCFIVFGKQIIQKLKGQWKVKETGINTSSKFKFKTCLLCICNSKKKDIDILNVTSPSP